MFHHEYNALEVQDTKSRLRWDAIVFWGCLILAGIVIALSGCATCSADRAGVQNCVSWPV